MFSLQMQPFIDLPLILGNMVPSPGPHLPHSGTTDIFGWIIPYCRCSPMYGKMFSQILDLHPLVASDITPHSGCENQNYPQILPNGLRCGVGA